MNSNGTANGKGSLLQRAGITGDKSPDKKAHVNRAVEQGRRSFVSSFLDVQPQWRKGAEKPAPDKLIGTTGSTPHEGEEGQETGQERDITGKNMQDITDEDIDGLFGFSDSSQSAELIIEGDSEDSFGGLEVDSVPPAPPTSEEREVSGSISEAVIDAAARLNAGREPSNLASETPIPEAAEQGAGTHVDSKDLKSERPTLPPPLMVAAPERTEGGRRSAIFPGSPPETQHRDTPDPVFERGTPTPPPVGFLRVGFPDTIPEAVFGAANKKDRQSILMEAAQGVPSHAIEAGSSSMGSTELREHSMVESRVQNIMSKMPSHFHPLIEEAMEILREGLVGYESLVEKFIRERRWTWKEEEILRGAYLKTADHLQRIFDKTYDKEADNRIKLRRESKGKLADTERLFTFTLIQSHDSHSNHETNIFDAFAKGVGFLYLLQQRPGSFIHAIGHPEISKPYGRLGGAENAGIAVGLRVHSENIRFAFLFRCYDEAHMVTVANELRDKVIKKPTRPLVGKFEHMVRKDVAEFETAVSQSGISPEKFFEVLNQGHTVESLRSSKELEQIFKTARNEGLIYNKTNDLFDAIELINEYMWALRFNPVARDFFLKFYLANYPLGEQSGNFYKMFGMCLFDSVEEIQARPVAKMAFENDPNPEVRKCFAKRLETLEFEERKTIVAGEENTGPDSDDDETDFF